MIFNHVMIQCIFICCIAEASQISQILTMNKTTQSERKYDVKDEFACKE